MKRKIIFFLITVFLNFHFFSEIVNWKGMEVNYVMTLDDYIAHLDMYELLSEPDF